MPSKKTTNSPTNRSINPHLKRRAARKTKSVADYVEGILAGNKIVLSQAITLIESSLEQHQKLAQAIIAACLPHSKSYFRVGITGTPGVGKSTFIEAFGQHLVEQQHRLAVLAIDPSSQMTKGSILGDKTRMEKLANLSDVFIRPSPAGKSLGGVARHTRETIILCEAAGFDTILIETVGVGQSETAVHAMTDCFLLLLQPGAGDELQGIKRGIVEMADLIAVNKADGEQLTIAKQAKRAYQNALHLFPAKENQWTPQVATCSALQNEGIPKIWALVEQFRTHVLSNQSFTKNRQSQNQQWFEESLKNGLEQLFFKQPNLLLQKQKLEQQILQGEITPYQAVQILLDGLRR